MVSHELRGTEGGEEELEEAALKGAVLDIVRGERIKNSCTISPIDNVVLDRWHIVMSVALLYTTFVTPFEVAFIHHTAMDGLFYADMLFNTLFFVDIISHFFLHYREPPSKGGHMVMGHRRIVKNYLKGMFFWDLAGTLPYPLLSTQFDSLSEMGVLRLLRLMRLLKLARIINGFKFVEDFRTTMSLSFSYTNMLSIVFVSCTIVHWLACIWGWAAYQSGRPLYETWMVTFYDDDFDDLGSYSDEDDTSLVFDKYIVALYVATMTVTSVGYGDVTATNTVEYLVLGLTVFAGAFIWTFVIAGAMGVFEGSFMMTAHFHETFDNTNYMLKDLAVDHTLAVEIREYVLHTYEKQKRSSYTALLDDLSEDLQKKMLMCSVSLSRIQPVFFLAGLHDDVVVKIFRAFKGYVHAPYEKLLRPETLHIIIDGYVAQMGKVYHQNDSFDHDFICFGLNPKLHKFRAAVARTFIHVDTLSRDAFYDIINSDPRVTEENWRVLRKARLLFALRHWAHNQLHGRHEDDHPILAGTARLDYVESKDEKNQVEKSMNAKKNWTKIREIVEGDQQRVCDECFMDFQPQSPMHPARKPRPSRKPIIANSHENSYWYADQSADEESLL